MGHLEVTPGTHVRIELSLLAKVLSSSMLEANAEQEKCSDYLLLQDLIIQSCQLISLICCRYEDAVYHCKHDSRSCALYKFTLPVICIQNALHSPASSCNRTCQPAFPAARTRSSKSANLWAPSFSGAGCA